MGIITTLVVCVVLATGSLLLSKITQDLVLTPIEEMINKVKDITKNPIEAAQQAEEDLVNLEKEEQLLQKTGTKKNNLKTVAPMETEVLQSTLTKIGGLLAIGFGEAGSHIIAENMK